MTIEITRYGEWFVITCEAPVLATQGRTIAAALRNFTDAYKLLTKAEPSVERDLAAAHPPIGEG